MALNAIVDLSHHNNNVNFEQAKADGLVGIIHKATQGLAYQDPLYAPHRQKALAAGLFWGAYHFGDGSDGVTQAEFFLSTAGIKPGTLLVLDFESNPAGPSMSLVEARAFITHIKEATGRWPGFYCGHYFKDLLGTKVDSVIGNCWLWLAQYGPTAVVPATWDRWTLWQYTDGAAGPQPHSVKGIGFCDRDQFNGTAAELQELWEAGSDAETADT